VAALLGVFPEDARRVLRSLTQANLVEQVAGHRYRLHDLLREYAIVRAATIALFANMTPELLLRRGNARFALGNFLAAAFDAERVAREAGLANVATPVMDG
jgi:hypothetical protein